MLDLIPSMAVWLHGLPGEQCAIVPSRHQRDWHTIYCIQLRVGVTTVDASPLNRFARNYGNTQNAKMTHLQ